MNEDRFSVMRAAMVASQLRTNAVTDPGLLDSFEAVARERFVPAAQGDVAYVDIALPIGDKRWLSPPLVTARLIGEARLRATDRVLLIGAATGYAAAVIAPLCAHVVAVEQDAALAASARANLAGVANVSCVEALLSSGHPDDAPYDAVLIDGAIEQLPPALIAQCAPGGRIVAGVEDRGVIRLCSGRRVGDSAALLPFADLAAPRLPGFARVREFSF